MEEDLEYFELSSIEDDTVPTIRAETIEQSPTNEPPDSSEENHPHTEDDWGTNESEPPMMVGIESSHALGTTTTSTTFSHDNLNASTVRSTGQAESFPPSRNPMLLEYLASPVSSSFSLHSSGFQNTFSSERPVQRKRSKFDFVDSIEEEIVSKSEKHHLFKLFLEKSSSWVRQYH
jgi:hypothetical protein